MEGIIGLKSTVVNRRGGQRQTTIYSHAYWNFDYMPSTTNRTAVPPLSRRERVGASTAAGQIDFFRLAWRYKVLLVVGILLGLGWGYYQYIQLPVAYVSTANIQIVEPAASALPIEGIDGGGKRRSLSDEAEVMRSEGLLKRAVEIGNLPDTPQFSGWNTESIAASLASSGSGLRIGALGRGQQNSSNIFSISFQGSDPITTQRIVQSIVDAYADHLQSQYSNVGKETVELIQSARNEVLARLETLEKEFDEFRQVSPLVIRDGHTASIHRENADHFLTQKQALVVRKMQLETTLRVAKEAIEADAPLESVLMALSGSTLVADRTAPLESKVVQDIKAARVRQFEQEAKISPSQRTREERLLPLEIEYNNLLLQFGAEHPAVKSLKTQVDLVAASIARLEKAEEEFTAKLREFEDAPPVDGKWQEVDVEQAIRRNLDLKLMSLNQQLIATQQEMDMFEKAYDYEMEIAKSENTAEMTVARFNREIARQQALYDRIVARLDEINLASEAGALRVFPLQSAKRGSQLTPPMSKSLLLGAFMGLMLAGALAYLREVSDKSYRSAEQVSEHLGVPVIGHVPLVKGETQLATAWATGLDPHLVAYYRPKSQSSEAFKAIRTALYFSNRSGDFKILQVTSPTPGDGKSTVAANLAIAMAQSGKSVLLVDTDLRRPRVQELFAIERQRGTAWLLTQLTKNPTPQQVKELLGEAIVESPVPNLSIMGAGARPDNPSELLSSTQFDVLSQVLRGLFDAVIIDSPPLLAVTDPSTLASRVDGVLLVVRLKKNAKPLAARASRMLETLQANVIGVVVNGVGSRTARGYGRYSDNEGYYNRGQHYQYGYGYSYGSSSEGKYDEYYSDEPELAKSRQNLAAKKVEA